MEHKVWTGAVVLAACAALAACGGGSSTTAGASSQAAEPSTSSAPAVTTTTPAPSTSSPAPATSTSAATTSSAPATKPAPAVVLVLEPDGLGYVAGGAAVKHLSFGSDATTVKNVVAKALGKPAVNDLPECGQGPRSSAVRAGFTVLLDGATFVGWSDQGAKGRTLTTLDGLGVGSTFADVKASRPGVTATSGTLGPEFTDTDGFGGILTGTSPKSRVTLLYAGETCFFR